MSAPRPRSGILEISPYVGGKAETGEGSHAAKLSANENALGPSPRAVEAYRAAGATLHRYPDGGSAELRRAIGRRFNIEPGRIVCGAGSDEIIGLLTRAYAGGGDEVLYSAHGFLMYRLSALAAGATPVAAPEKGLRADVDALLAHVTSRTRIVYLANPNNPTGSYLTSEELARLHAGLPSDVLLVIDAAYAEFVTEADYDNGLGLALEYDNVIMTRTFSKLYGLAALRIGWAAGSAAVIDVLNRTRGPFNVSAPSQAAAVAALEDLEHQERSRAHNSRWLAWLATEIAALDLTVHPSAGNFLLVEFTRSPGRDATAAARYLEKHGVIPREMGGYGLGHCLRISVGLEDENRRVIDVLREFLK